MRDPASRVARRFVAPLTALVLRRSPGAAVASAPARILHGALLLPALVAAVPAAGQSLGGSPRSLDVQVEAARAHDFTFIANARQLSRFVAAGYLVRVEASADLDLSGVSYPYARPQVRLFLERLSGQYRRACGEQLVVTSLTRPASAQPSNASPLSVHPTGMAVDIRRSTNRSCRAWLERVLLSLEGRELLEATRETDPPHYHVAVFPRPYARYVSRLVKATPVAYRVRAGDSLWAIAQEFDTTVRELIEENDLESSRIYAGQVLTIPSGK